MISDADKQILKKISKKYKAKRVILFGSSLDSKKVSKDIDIAVEGIPPREFFRYYGDLLFALSKPVDVIDLSITSKFVQMIKKEGVLIYG